MVQGQGKGEKRTRLKHGSCALVFQQSSKGHLEANNRLKKPFLGFASSSSWSPTGSGWTGKADPSKAAFGFVTHSRSAVSFPYRCSMTLYASLMTGRSEEHT